MTFQVDHIGMNVGIYKARTDAKVLKQVSQDETEAYEAVTYDIRLRRPYDDKLLSIEKLHTLEHVLSVALRQPIYEEQFSAYKPDPELELIYEGAMACQTGMYFIFFGPEQLVNSPSVIGTRIRCAARYAINMPEVPAKEMSRCGNYYSLLTIHDIMPELELLENLATRVCSVNYAFDQYKMIEEQV